MSIFDEAALRALLRDVVREEVRAAVNELVLPNLARGGDYVDAKGSGLDRATFKRAAREIGVHRVGRKHMVSRTALATWIEAQRVATDKRDEDEMDRRLRLVREGDKR